MSILQWTKRFENRYAVGFAGLVLAVLAFWPSIQPYVKPPKASLAYVVRGDNVLDVHQPIGGLKILFNEEDLQKRDLNLKLLTVRVENTGDVDLLQGMYDIELPWGFEVEGGEPLEPRIIGGDSSYLQTQTAKLQGKTSVVFRKLILEKGKSFTAQVLVVHARGRAPRVRPIGKIAGIGEIAVIEAAEAKKERGYLAEVFGGTWGVQISRLGFYFFGAVICIILLVVVMSTIGSLKNRMAARRRKRVLAASLGLDKWPESSLHIAFFDVVDGAKLTELRELDELLANPITLREEYQKAKKRREKGIPTGIEFAVEDVYVNGEMLHRRLNRAGSSRLSTLLRLVMAHVIFEDEAGNPVVLPEFRRLLSKLLERKIEDEREGKAIAIEKQAGNGLSPKPDGDEVDAKRD